MRKKLKIALLQKEINHYEFAENVGISESHLSKIMNGKTDGSMKFWKKAAEVLECNVSDIIE